jgi:hypothetical protein
MGIEEIAMTFQQHRESQEGKPIDKRKNMPASVQVQLSNASRNYAAAASTILQLYGAVKGIHTLTSRQLDELKEINQ